jgi:hypothetical protein
MSMDKLENTAHVNSIEVIKSKLVHIIITQTLVKKKKIPLIMKDDPSIPIERKVRF